MCMKSINALLVVGLVVILSSSCSHDGYKEAVVHDEKVTNVLFLHHSTGNNIYKGAMNDGQPDVKKWFLDYNEKHDLKINFVERSFPLSKRYMILSGYGWKNYPYDYYNIWVKHGEDNSFKNEPTLKVLTPLWDVIVFKHCYPVSSIKEDQEVSIDSNQKNLTNYKMQYEALKNKLREYPDTKFIVWTGAALVKNATDEPKALRAKEFFNWVINDWDEPGDNIFLWDFYDLQTEGGLYFKDEYAAGKKDSHPNRIFSAQTAPLFCNRIIDVVNNKGELTELTGKHLSLTEE